MKERRDPKAAIYIEEEHNYEVNLDLQLNIAWKKASGNIRVEIPYDGAILDKELIHLASYPIGRIDVTQPDKSTIESLPINLESNGNWDEQIKSNKKCIVQSQYNIEEPGDPLISIYGVVLDDIVNEDHHTMEGILGKVDVFSNPLAFQLSLWVPDLLADSRPDEMYELETILLRGENTRNLFIPQINSLNFEKQLAEGLTALANTAGGTILIGVSKNGHVLGIASDRDSNSVFHTALLSAALQVEPPVPIWRLSEIQHSSGKFVARIEVPNSSSAMHHLRGHFYKRQGSKNTSGQQKLLNSVVVPPFPESSLNEIFSRDEAGTISFRNQDDVVVLNGSNGLRNLRLGAYICGLINAGKRTGRIIITDLPINEQRPVAIFRNLENPEKIIAKEMGKLLPKFSAPVIEPRHLGSRKIIIIHVPTWQYPICLYNNRGYEWQNLVLSEIKVGDLFEKYVEMTSSKGQVFDEQVAYLEMACLNRPVRPPEEIEHSRLGGGQEGLSYDVEYQAQVWEPRPFKHDEDTVGYSLQLTAPLKHISLTGKDEGSLDKKDPEANGSIRIRLNDVLVSGLQVKPEANDKNSWLNAIPIIKRTYLNINYKARLNELFRRRTKTSRLRFLIPDVLLDRERVDDLAHVCADVGFRVFDIRLFDMNSTVAAKATIQGISSSGFHDISLLIGLICERSELKRELHYDGWRDSKVTSTSILDVRVKLWGTGEGVGSEIGRLQMELYKTMSRRLQHLRGE